MIEAAVLFLIATGTAFMFLAAVGLLRLPDVLTRMHASTKGATLGIAGIFMATALHFRDLENVAESLLVISFVFLTAPVGAHTIARAARIAGLPLWKGTVTDEMSTRLGREKDASSPPDL